LFGVAAVAVPSVLGLLQIGTEFTKAGAEGFDRVLGKLRIPQHWRVEVKLALTLGILGLLLGLWLQLPALSVAENGWAMKHYSAGKLGDAEQGFLKAIALDGDNAEAHYNLGALYEDLEQQDKAKKEYLIAIAGGIPDAYNNLARLYLKEKKYAEAAALLNRGMGESEDKPEGAEDPPLLAYNLRKNLGWVRLEQKQYDDAKDLLTEAIALSERPEAVKVGVNPSSAHCLLAQVLERQKQGAIAAWRQCQDLATGMNPDEDAWLYEAQQKLDQASMKSK
jgi:tetratricopeptide (TPR) repeat protein